jgi:integrase
MLIDIKGASVSDKPRTDGRFQGYVKKDGVKTFFYGRTKKEVCDKITVFFNKKTEQPKRQKSNEYTLYEWLEKWQELYKQNLKPGTKNEIERYARYIKELLPDKKLSGFTPLELQEKLLSVTAARKRQLLLLYLNDAFNKAEKLKLIKSNPCAAVTIPKVKKSKRKALTKAQQAAFTEAIKNHPLEPLYKLLLFTGVRIGEALALNAADITDNFIEINKNVVFVGRKRIVQDAPKSEAGNRKIPLPPEVKELLRPLMPGLFAKIKYDYCRKEIKKIFKELNMSEFSMHSLRHTYATRIEEAGIPPKLKACLLGHSTIEVTQNIYTDVQDDFINAKTAEILNALKPTDK